LHLENYDISTHTVFSGHSGQLFSASFLLRHS
jgi:hypothetical protein